MAPRTTTVTRKRTAEKKAFAGRLASIRGDRSQRQFAKDLGVFQQNINRYEKGTTPAADFLMTIALKEGVSINWLLLGIGRQRIPSGRS